VRRVRAEGRSLVVLGSLFRLAWQAVGCAPRDCMVASLPSLAGFVLARGSRLLHAVCMVLYTASHVDTYRIHMIAYAGCTCKYECVYAARTE
jgi:hypothetical protein